MIGRPVFALACIATGILLCPILHAEPQESSPPEQKAQEKTAQGPVMEADPSAQYLEKGFRHLYELNFDGARVEFFAYQKSRPDDPLGKAAEAASYLFEQFNAKGVLTSEFFLSDAKFLGGVDGDASQNQNPAFVEANNRARELAKRRLKSNPHD